MSLTECYRSALGAVNRVQNIFGNDAQSLQPIYKYSGNAGVIVAILGGRYLTVTLVGDPVHYDLTDALTAGRRFQDVACNRCLLHQAGACTKRVEAVTDLSLVSRLSINLTTIAGYIAQSFRSMTLLKTHPIWSTRITAHIDHTKAFGILGCAQCMYRSNPNHILSELNT